MKYGKRCRVPRYIWIAYDPQGKPRRSYLERPNEDVLAWIYASDDPNRSGLNITTPTDTIAAKAAGYRLRCSEIHGFFSRRESDRFVNFV